jgi:hypothetical protein
MTDQDPLETDLDETPEIDMVEEYLDDSETETAPATAAAAPGEEPALSQNSMNQ